MAQSPISVLMLTYNEEQNLDLCLRELTRWVTDIVIIDSFSTDCTLEIAAKYGARVYQHVFEGHARQWTWGLKNVTFASEWVFMHDPDHQVTPELREAIIQLFNSGIPGDVNGIFIRRRNVFRGRWIKHGGYYPKYMLKIFRAHLAELDEYEFDYRVYVPGKTMKLHYDIVEYNRNEDDITFWIDKHNKFAVRLAQEEIYRRKAGVNWKVSPTLLGTPDQRVLYFKSIWCRLPLYLRPFIYFVHRYFFQFGFLDGKEGFIFHFLHAFWYRLLVDIKLEELQAEKEEMRNAEPGTKSEGLKART